MVAKERSRESGHWMGGGGGKGDLIDYSEKESSQKGKGESR